jgi:DNA-binding IclR family transcriptional regulator
MKAKQTDNKKKKPGKTARISAPQEYSAPALQKGFEIVELLATAPGGLTVSDIAARLDRSMSEVFRIILVMVAQGLLEKNAQTDLYTVTYRLLELALRATPARSLSAVAAPVMERLSISTNQSCHLVVRTGNHGLVIHRQENAGLQGGFAVRSGAHVDLVRSCSGHVLLAFAALHHYDEVIRQLPRPLKWPLAKLAREVARVRKRGYEMRPSARTAGVTDVSYPILGFDGAILAALTVPYLTLLDNTAPTTLEETRALLSTAAREVSIGLGGEIGVRPHFRGGNGA